MRPAKPRPATAAFGQAGRRFFCALCAILLFACANFTPRAQDRAADDSSLTPLQQEVQKQRRRLNSSETEERRDALMRLGWLKHPESARAAAAALSDSEAIVRATAAHSVLALPGDEAAALLVPLLQDRDPFVRQETAYALGETRARGAVTALVALLTKEKEDGVRGAAAVALGQIGDEAAVIPLAELLGRRVPAGGILARVRRSKKDENEFVRRAAAHSLGQIGSRAAVPALVAVLGDERAPEDVRREAAVSLGLIGDASATTALRSVLESHDPYLSRASYEALMKLAPNQSPR